MGLFGTDYIKNNPDKEIPLFMNCIYVGGCSQINGSNINHVFIMTKNREIILYYNGKVLFAIPFDDIKDIVLQTREELMQRITISRLILLGVFALGVPKREFIVTKYAVINYANKNGDEEDIVLQSNKSEKIVDELKKLILN